MSKNNPNTEQFGDRGLGEIYKSSKAALWRKVFEIPTVKYLLDTIEPEKSVLDLGCGAGFYLPNMLDRQPIFIEAIDSCEEQILTAKSNF